MKVKTISLALVLIGLLLWWEIPILCMACVLMNILLLIKHYDKSIFYKIIIGMSFGVVVLCIWNCDLHVGITILDYLNFKK